MSTSGNTTWELTRDDIIAAALRKMGVLEEGGVPNAEQLATGSQALNGLVALFATKGMPLWKRQEQIITPVLGQQAYTITNAVKVPQVVLRYVNNSTQYELISKSEYDFNQLPQGTINAGTAVHYYLAPGLEDTVLNIWPVPDAGMVANNLLVAIKQKEFDGFFSASETPDFPAYYTDALVYTLASRLAPEYGVSPSDRQMLKQEAREFTEEAFGYGDEDASWFFQPSRRMTGG